MTQEVFGTERAIRRNDMGSVRWACMQTILSLVAIVGIGCSQAIGPSFQPVENFGSERTVVYFYFPFQIGWDDSHTILVDRRVLTRLDREGYYPFVTRPGPMVFAMEGWPEEESLKVDLEPGKTYFVKVSLVGRGVFTHNRYYQLELTPPDIATHEIKGLRLMKSCRTTQGCEGGE